VKRNLLLIIVMIITCTAFSQGGLVLTDKDFSTEIERDPELESFLNQNSAYRQLQKQEREVVYWINYVRKQPDKFNKQVLQPFLQQFPEAKNAYSRSLGRELSALQPLPLLSVSDHLNRTTHTHASDLGSNNKQISHISSKGESFKERMNRMGLYECVSENIYQGKEKGLEAVLLLLIDAGVKNLGHRKNILDPGMKYTGVSFFPIKGSSHSYMVQHFSCN
jgi:uncharacterized protein YkwD